MGGTFDEVLFGVSWAEYAACGWKGFGCSWVVHARCWVLRDRMRLGAVPVLAGVVFGRGRTSGPFLVAGFGSRGRYRPYFENYTVDASIFELTSVSSYR